MGEKFYIIRKGRVTATFGEGTATQQEMVMGPPQFFGELALLHDQPRSGTRVVSEDAELLTLTRPQFLALMKGAPTLEQPIRRHLFSG